MNRRRRRTFAPPLTLLLVLGCGSGPNPASQSEPTLPLAKLESIVEEYRARNEVPAVALGLITPAGRFALFYGTQRRGTDEPPNIDTVFEIGSITKTFTATSLAWMSARGDVTLDDAFSQHLPRAEAGGVDMPTWSGPGQGGTNDMLLREAADFTPGFADVSFPSAQEVFDHINFEGNEALQFQPGACYLYSDLGWELLGYTLAHVKADGDGYDYGTLLAETLDAAALAMPDTVIDLSASQRDRLAPGYRDGERGPVPFQTGGLLIKSTIRDMREWLAFHMGLAPESPLHSLLPEIRQVRYSGSGFTDGTCGGPGATTALGWFYQDDFRSAGAMYSKNGATTGYSSWTGYVPDRGTGVIVLTNQGEGHATVLGLDVLCAITDGCGSEETGR